MSLSPKKGCVYKKKCVDTFYELCDDDTLFGERSQEKGVRWMNEAEKRVSVEALISNLPRLVAFSIAFPFLTPKNSQK